MPAAAGPLHDAARDAAQVQHLLYRTSIAEFARLTVTGDGAARDHRLECRDAELGALLDQEIDRILFQRREAQPEVGHAVLVAALGGDTQGEDALVEVGDLRRELAVAAVEQHHRIAHGAAHDVAQIMLCALLRRDLQPGGEIGCHVEARNHGAAAPRRPSGRFDFTARINDLVPLPAGQPGCNVPPL